MSSSIQISVLSAIALLAAAHGAASAAEGTQQGQVPFYQELHWPVAGGHELSEEERAAFRARLRQANSPQERESIRAEREALEQARRAQTALPPTGSAATTRSGPSPEPPAATQAKERDAGLPPRSSEVHGGARDDHRLGDTAEVPSPPLPESANARRGFSEAPRQGAGFLGIFPPAPMSEEEQAAYRAQLRAAKTSAERDALRVRHRRELRERTEGASGGQR
jgi:hypothetical protein